MTDFPTLGPQCVAWAEQNLVHGEGDLLGAPYRFEPWMRAVIYKIYEYDPDTLRRFVERVVIGIAKGNAKTEFAAVLGLIEAAGPSVPTGDGRGKMRDSPNVPIAAASRDQANQCFGALGTMITEGPLAQFFDVQQFVITMKGRRGKLYRIAAEAGTQDGTLPTAFVADEVHEWVGRKARVHTVVTNSLRKRRGKTGNTLEVNISTAGDPGLSDLWLELYEYGRKVKTGEIVDPSFLFVWFEPSDEHLDLNDHDALLAALEEANPSSWVNIEGLAAEWERGTIREHVFRRYHLNQWVTTGSTYLPDGEWLGCMDEDYVIKDGEVRVMAFDGSHNRDSTALYGCTPDGHVFEWAVWERPEQAVEWKIPRSDVDAKVDEAFRRFPKLVLFCDPAKWAMYLDAWAERYGEDRVLEMPNTRERMAPATGKFYDAVVDRELSHDGRPTLTRHLKNATVKEIPGGRYVLRKDHPNRKIDAAIAAVMAYDRATVTVEEDPTPSISFW